MKRLKYLLLASLVAFAACDEESVDPLTQVGSVNVTVTAGGAPLAGVTVSLGAAGTTPQVTTAAGTAGFTNVPVGTYTVTLTGVSADVICSSTTQPVTVAASATTAVTFACNIVRTSSVSGTVAFSNGDPRPNATVTITRTLPAPADAAVNLTTNGQGQYSLTGLRAGTYTVSLGITTGCTTAANTQTVQIAAGEARVVNFTCTVAPPPDPTVPATVAIQSITATGALGNQIPVPSNQVNGLVNVNLGIEEGEQRVTRMRLRLGTQTVCDQTFVAAPSSEQELATFNVVCPVNTANFDGTTGVPQFLNAAANLVADIFTVAGGATAAVHTATLAVTLANQDATYAIVTAERNALSTNTTAGGAGNAGRFWWGGDLTVRALPVMYSGLAVQSVTLMVTGFVPDPDDGNDENILASYYHGDGDEETASITLTAAPYSVVLQDDDDQGDDGVDDIEDPDLEVSVAVLRGDGQPGPGFTNISTICSDGRLPNFIVFPFTNGCASGQPSQSMRLDNYAPIVGALDRMGRWSAQYAWPSRLLAGAPVDDYDDLLDALDPVEYDFTNTGVTGWLSEAFTFGATRVVGSDDLEDLHDDLQNATQPLVADLGVGLPTTGHAIFRMGTATDQMTEVTTPANLNETFDANVYFMNVTVRDVFGAAGATTNQRTRFYDRSFDGTSTSTANLTALAAAANVKAGVDKGDPCYTSDGLTCNNQFLNTTRLDQDREVIGVAGAPTLGGGGVMSGTAIVTQKMDPQGAGGGAPSGFPSNANITRIRRMAPSTIVTSARNGCWVGVLSSQNTVCSFAGASGSLSGTNDAFDFYDPQDGGQFYTQISPLTGAVTNVNVDRSTGALSASLDMDTRLAADPTGLINTGYFVVEKRVVDNAGNSSPTVTRTFVWDRDAPDVGGVSSPATATPGGQVQYSVGVADELDLDRAEFFLRWSGALLAVLQNTTAIGAFGPDAYTTTGSAAATVQYFHNLRVAGGGVFATSGAIFRVFDFGRNAAEAVGATPAVVNPPAEPGDITVTSLFSSTAIVCWDTDANGCTNPTTATLTLQVQRPAITQVPFNRVDFLVGIDVNNDGLVDVDGAGNQLFAPLAVNSAVSILNDVSTYSRAVTVQDIVNASRRTTIPAVPDATSNVHIRAIGYRPDGNAFTVAAGAAACTAVAGSNAACTISLQRQ